MAGFSSVADTIGAIITGGIVGIVLISAERRLERRAAERSVRDARATAVAKSQRLLGGEELFFDRTSLLPGASDRFDAMQAQAESVPQASVASSLAFQYLEGIALAWSDMKNAAEGIEAQFPSEFRHAYAGRPGYEGAGAVERFREYMHSHFPPAHGPDLTPKTWEEYWEGAYYPPADREFLDEIRRYRDARHRFRTYRVGLSIINEPAARQKAQALRDAAPEKRLWQRWIADARFRKNLRDELHASEARARSSVDSWLTTDNRSFGRIVDW